jgi:hypothetical protein
VPNDPRWAQWDFAVRVLVLLGHAVDMFTQFTQFMRFRVGMEGQFFWSHIVAAASRC